MGIEQEFVFGLNCARCFDFLKAPLVMRMSVQGIAKGNDWTPVDPEPPNGTYLLQNQGLCDFVEFQALSSGTCTFHAGGTQMTVFVFGVGPAFVSNTANQCWQTGINSIVGAVGNVYHGGSAMVSFSGE